MTAIWDRLGSESLQLSEKWDEARAKKLKDCLNAVYMSIKDFPEYSDLKFYHLRVIRDNPDLKLLDGLKKIIDSEWKQGTMYYVVEAIDVLHDFDHKDLPVKRTKTYGHHTEEVIRRNKNKQYAKLLTKIHYDSWWSGEEDES